MALRIACDLDGTLADMQSALQTEATRLFGPAVDLCASDSDLDETIEPVEANGYAPGVAAPIGTRAGTRRPPTRAEMNLLWAHVRRVHNFWTTLNELETGMVARLGVLASEHSWEVIFLTQRPSTEGDTAQVQTQRWLEAHGFARPSVFVLNGSRGKAAAAFALDVVIDDNRDNALDVLADSKAHAVLIERDAAEPAQRLGPKGRISIVPSFCAALDHLEQTTHGTPGRRLMNRLRSVFRR